MSDIKYFLDAMTEYARLKNSYDQKLEGNSNWSDSPEAYDIRTNMRDVAVRAESLLKAIIGKSGS